MQSQQQQLEQQSVCSTQQAHPLFFLEQQRRRQQQQQVGYNSRKILPDSSWQRPQDLSDEANEAYKQQLQLQSDQFEPTSTVYKSFVNSGNQVYEQHNYQSQSQSQSVLQQQQRQPQQVLQESKLDTSSSALKPSLPKLPIIGQQLPITSQSAIEERRRKLTAVSDNPGNSAQIIRQQPAITKSTPLRQTMQLQPSKGAAVPTSRRQEYIWDKSLEQAVIANQTYRTVPIIQAKAKVSYDRPTNVCYSKLNFDPTYQLLNSRSKPKQQPKFNLVAQQPRAPPVQTQLSSLNQEQSSLFSSNQQQLHQLYQQPQLQQQQLQDEDSTLR